jgi:molecular chaperone GrpE
VAAQRATADYRNLQRDTEQRLSDMRKYSTEQLLVELCPLVDYFDSAFAVIPADQQTVPWLQGVKHIQTYLLQVLKNNGVERMPTVGQLFNPEWHESVGEEESDEPEHIIIKELQAGFTLQGKAIRHARVVIAKAKTAATTNQ